MQYRQGPTNTCRPSFSTSGPSMLCTHSLSSRELALFYGCCRGGARELRRHLWALRKFVKSLRSTLGGQEPGTAHDMIEGAYASWVMVDSFACREEMVLLLTSGWVLEPARRLYVSGW